MRWASRSACADSSLACTRNSSAIFGEARPVGGEVVALVAQHAHQLGGQRVVEQLDDVLAPRAVARRHRAFVQAVRAPPRWPLRPAPSACGRQRQRLDVAGFVDGGHGVVPGGCCALDRCDGAPMRCMNCRSARRRAAIGARRLRAVGRRRASLRRGSPAPRCTAPRGRGRSAGGTGCGGSSSGITKQLLRRQRRPVQRLARAQQLRTGSAAAHVQRGRGVAARTRMKRIVRPSRAASARPRPVRGQAGRERQLLRALLQAEDRLDRRAVHPGRRAGVPAPAAAADIGRLACRRRRPSHRARCRRPRHASAWRARCAGLR